ncbi:MAG: prepilin peptidase [bacterium]|nr:prepilin peptidase [bacterium]
MTMNAIPYLIIFTYGIVIGSFLNVLIYRIPKQEDFVKTRSHCMSCGYQLRWYDLIPVGSYLFLKGKCRKCDTKLSIQYPMIECVNGILYVLIFYSYGITMTSVLYALTASALLSLSMIDFQTFEIPVGFNLFIAAVGLVHLALDYQNWSDYLIGAVSVSGFILLLIIATKGRGMGGGDLKLMAAVGLLLGWKLTILAFFLGCVFGSILHITRMKITKADHMLAFGPYLSMGIIVSMLYGEQLIRLYINTMFY